MEYTFSSADEVRRQKLGKIIAQELAQKDKESMEYLIADARGRWLYMRLLERCHMFGSTCPDESKPNTALVWEGERGLALSSVRISCVSESRDEKVRRLPKRNIGPTKTTSTNFMKNRQRRKNDMNEFEYRLQRFAEGGESGGGESEGGEASGSILGGASSDPQLPEPAGETNSSGEEGTEGSAPQKGEAGEGAPETYDFKAIVPEGMEYDEKSAGEYSALARECGLTQEQASKIASYGMNLMKGNAEAAMQAMQQQRAQWAENAKTELGADFAPTVAKCGVAMEALDRKIPGLRQAFDETGAGNRIEVIKAMAMLGELIGEDRGHSAGGGAGGEAPIYGNTNFNLY